MACCNTPLGCHAIGKGSHIQHSLMVTPQRTACDGPMTVYHSRGASSLLGHGHGAYEGWARSYEDRKKSGHHLPAQIATADCAAGKAKFTSSNPRGLRRARAPLKRRPRERRALQ